MTFSKLDHVQVDVKTGLFKSNQITSPMVGFGTDKLNDQVLIDAMMNAADAGYRIFDTATAYNNQEAIGNALKKLDRQQFYIVSKVWHDMLDPKQVRQDIDTTLKRLQSDYLDAYLIHWPNHTTAIDKTLATMEELRQQKKIHHIGICNVTVNHMKKVLAVGVPISWVQVEMNPNFFDKALYDLCLQHGVAYQGWRPLAFGVLSQDTLLSDIGKKYNKSASQVAIKWATQHGCIPLPGSKNKQHIQENINILDFSLSAEDIHLIDQRAIPGKRFRLQLDYGLGFTDEFDLSYDQCWPSYQP